MSDHNLCCVSLDSMKVKRKRTFMFMNCLLESEELKQLIQVCWLSLNFLGSRMFSFSRKLKELKGIIRNYSKQRYSNLEIRVRQAHDNMLQLQRDLLASPSQFLASEE